jgi:hypothetical protein
MRVAAPYDIQGNLPALDAVCSMPPAASWSDVGGGDVLPGQMPQETEARLLRLDIPRPHWHPKETSSWPAVRRFRRRETERRLPFEKRAQNAQLLELLETVVLRAGFDNSISDVQQRILGHSNGKSFDTARSNEAAGETDLATFACRILLNMSRLRESAREVVAGPRASGCFEALKKYPHEMGSKKGNVKIRRKVHHL